MGEEARIGIKVRAREDRGMLRPGSMRLQRFAAAIAAIPAAILDHRDAEGG